MGYQSEREIDRHIDDGRLSVSEHTGSSIARTVEGGRMASIVNGAPTDLLSGQ